MPSYQQLRICVRYHVVRLAYLFLIMRITSGVDGVTNSANILEHLSRGRLIDLVVNVVGGVRYLLFFNDNA